MMLADGTLEYIYTAGVLVSFLGLIIGTAAQQEAHSCSCCTSPADSRGGTCCSPSPRWRVFLAIVIVWMKPTQLLFFDDAIYQSMALDLLHTGQAWMCNYGTPTQCFSGQIFHEPIGLSFNIAIGFLLLGVHRVLRVRGADRARRPLGVHDIHGRIPPPQGQAGRPLLRPCARGAPDNPCLGRSDQLRHGDPRLLANLGLHADRPDKEEERALALQLPALALPAALHEGRRARLRPDLRAHVPAALREGVRSRPSRRRLAQPRRTSSTRGS